MAVKGIFSLASMVLVAGALLFMLFILLAGAVDGNPVNRWYFLSADTSNIANAPDRSRWTYWNVCADVNGINVCDGPGYGNISPDRPLDPVRNFGFSDGIPQDFIDHQRYYYLMTRFTFPFMLIALVFAALSLFTGLLALCTRLGAYISGAMTTVAFVFQALNAALMTAAYVRGRNAFRAEGLDANIGQYAFGFEWAAFVCLFLATVLFCVGGSASKSDSYGSSRRGGFFRGRRSKSTRSRGSFINGDKEYA